MSFGRVNRREFVTHAASAGMALPMLGWMNSARAALEGKGKGKSGHTRSLILLWMGGGPSTIDLWDLKPGSKNGGEFKPISSTGAGQVSEHLPRMARVMKNLNIVRSYNSRDGAHERGTYINHTAYAPVPTVVHPSIGGVVASRNTPETLDIPGHICLGGAGLSPGFLGTQYAPFRVEAGPNPIPNLKSPVDANRFATRVAALREEQELFARQNRGDNPKDHKIIYDKTFKLMGSATLEAFKIEKEPDAVQSKYGKTGFGKNCLLARRLVEIGVPFIEVGFGGWDMHQGIFNALAGTGRGMAGNAGANATPKLTELDGGFSALVEDLVARGLWATTTVVWMGDFGRTPRINQDGGRDHWPSPWSVVLGGGGMKGGEVVGATDDDGMTVKDRPVEVSNLFATLYKSLGIEPNTELRSPNGRPIKLTGTFGDGEIIKELF